MDVLYKRCAGLDVHKDSVVACVRLADGPTVVREVRTFATTTSALLDLSAWLAEHGYDEQYGARPLRRREAGRGIGEKKDRYQSLHVS